MEIQKIQSTILEDNEKIKLMRIQKRKEALKRAQQKYYNKNKEDINNKHKEYIKNNPEENNRRASKYYNKLKENPEEYKKLSEYNKQRYQQKKQIKQDDEDSN